MKNTLWIILVLLFSSLELGCGGGTAGTGGITVSGTVENERQQPLAGVLVSIPNPNDPSGFESVITDEQGEFQLYADSQTSYQVVLVKDGVKTELFLDSIPTNATQVTATFILDASKPGTGTVADVQATRETEVELNHVETHSGNTGGGSNNNSSTNSGTSTSPRPTETPEISTGEEESAGNGNSSSSEMGETDSSVSSGNDLNDGEDDFHPTPNPSPGATPTATPTPSEDDDSTQSGTQSGGGSQEGSKSVTGNISTISSSSITVNGTTFIINRETEFRDASGEDSDISQFSTGVHVRVKGEYEHGILVAHEVEVRG